MTVRLSIIIPTIGRPTLARTIESVLSCGFRESSDELIVVGDGVQTQARKIVESFSGRAVYLETEPDHFFGHPQRNAGTTLANGTHLLSIDDDDVYVRNALKTIREAAEEDPAKINIFKMRAQSPRLEWGMCWKTKEVKCGNVGTPMFLVPLIPGRLGRWGSQYTGDLDFISETMELYPNKQDDVIWREDVVADIY